MSICHGIEFIKFPAGFMYFNLAVALLRIWQGVGSSPLLPSDSLFSAGSGSWHDSLSSELQFEACFPESDFRFLLSSATDDPTDPAKVLQRDSLVSFWQLTGAGAWVSYDNWGEGDPCFRSWYGLECDCDGFVTKIVLPDNGISGSVPAVLASLPRLKVLDLHTSTRLTNGIPNAGGNSLSGSMPSLAALTHLAVLDISLNAITALPELKTATIVGIVKNLIIKLQR